MSTNLILNSDPRSEEWFIGRLGVKTASEISAIMPDKRTGKRKASFETYLDKKVGEICSRFYEEIDAKPLEWGRLNEDAAIAAYEFASGNTVNKCSLVYKNDSKRDAATPDGWIKSLNRGLENKAPLTIKPHIAFIRRGEIDSDYILQCQFGMWVTDAETWDFTMFHPRMLMNQVHYTTIERDLKTMQIFDEVCAEFDHEMDKALAIFGLKYGDQWEK